MTSFFTTTALAAKTMSAAFDSFARGNLSAFQNLDWTYAVEIGTTAAADRIPFVGPWSETFGSLAGKAAELSIRAEEACHQ